MSRRCLPFLPRPGLWLGILGAAGVSLSSGQPASAVAGPVVQLPTFTVTDTRLLPEPEAWRYGQAPGFEILSNASDRTTKGMMRDFLLFQRAMGLVWPAIRRNFDLPVSLIFCAHSKSFGEFAPADAQGNLRGTVSLTLRDRELSAIVIDLGAAAADGGGQAEGEGGSGQADHVLRSEYVYFLLSRSNPRPPPWLQKGLTELFMAMTYSDDTFGFPGLADSGDLAPRKALAARIKAAGGAPAAVAGDAELKAAQERGALIPLDQMFSEGAASTGDSVGSTWEKQCYEFVHLCLFGDAKRFRVPFVEFVVHSALERPTEDLFRQYFQMGYEEMLATLWAYTGFANDRGYAVKGADAKKNPAPAAVSLRAATDAESGRIKGDALRMGQRAEASHLHLIAPYLRGSRDPQLLAALGLEEHAAGHDERAGKFLEAAVAAGTTRARAYLDLARLRFAAAEAQPAGAGGPLGAAQLRDVLALLTSAQAHPPALPEVYDLVAEAWSHSATVPTRQNLAVIDQGAQQFPDDSGLIYADAELRLKCGLPQDATVLARFGERYAPDPAAKERFRTFLASLPSDPGGRRSSSAASNVPSQSPEPPK